MVDPPRKGLEAEIIPTISAMGPERVVYVSCDPGTLARDVKRFQEAGYVPARAAAVDMFPRTAHVETCILLCSCESTAVFQLSCGTGKCFLTGSARRFLSPKS